MKKNFNLLLVASLTLLICGCGTFVQNTQKARYAADTLADGAVKGYAEYWKSATNNPAAYGRTLDGLMKERDQVLAASRKVSASSVTLGRLLLVYQTNNAVKPTIQGVITTLTTEATDLSNLAGYLMGPGSTHFSALPQ